MNKKLFVLVLITVIVIEVLALYVICALVGRLIGMPPLPAWVCIIVVLIANALFGRKVYGKKK